MPAMHRCAPQRLKDVAARFARQGTQRHRSIGGPERRRPHIRDLVVQRIGQNGQTVDIGQLSLIRRHAKGGVAFGMFNAGIALPRGKLDVRHLHIVLKIQPHLGAQFGIGPLRHHPDRLHRGLCGDVSLGQIGIGLQAHLTDDFARDTSRIGQRAVGLQFAIGRPSAKDHRFAVLTRWWTRRVGTKMRLRFVPNQLAAAMAEQMHDRRPAPRHRHNVAGDLLQHGPFARLQPDRHPRHPLATLDLDDRPACGDANTHRARLIRQIAGHIGPCIDDQWHLQPGVA